MGQNYYEMLGISRNASQKQISKAYYKVARRHHPDIRSKKDLIMLEDRMDVTQTQAFKMITFAYNTLKDPELRRQYDASLGPDLARLTRTYNVIKSGVFGQLVPDDESDEIQAPNGVNGNHNSNLGDALKKIIDRIRLLIQR
jgi:DnaJ-class molecular chaperone